MTLYISYLLKLSISLGVVWLFYQLFLRRLTFYTWNRWYLLVYSLVCFFIPLIDIRLFVKEDLPGAASFAGEIPVLLSVSANGSVVTTAHPSLNGWDLMELLFITGAVLMLIRLLFRIISLQKMKGRATQIDGGGRFFVYDINKPVIPFSFGRSIFINPRLHSQDEWKEIILHEYVHVRQHHTIDILVGELLCIVNWYNPFAWLMRFSIRQNLEFIADEQVIGNGSDKIEYQYHLLKVVGVNEYRIANSFNFSSLKKRIIMMNKSKSARLNLVRFLFIFPLLTVLLLAFRNKYTAMAAENSKEAAIAASASKTAPSDPGTTTENAMKPTAYKNKAIIDKAIVPTTKTGKEAAKEIVSVTDSTRVLQLLNDTVPVPSIFNTQHDFAHKTLFVVDGTPMPEGWSYKSIPDSNIRQINVIKDGSASRLYGLNTADEVVEITTKIPKSAVIHLHNSNPGPPPLYFIDGVEVDSAQMMKISPNDIESINVLKGQSVTDKYGERGKYGVILLTMKKSDSTVSGKASSFIIHFDKSLLPPPIYVVNGQETDASLLAKIPPSAIDSISVIKGEEAIKRYGEKARNGVIQVHLKDSVALPAFQ